MKLQVGSGNVRLTGFTNVDIRRVSHADVVGHAGDLRGVASGSVELLFSHALLEHIFLGQQILVLEEWKRVVAPSGLIICLAIPDFAKIADLYLKRARGIVGERFDLFNVYRYTHGEPEHASPPWWRDWQPLKQPNSGPPGWLPQLHKCLFDASYVHDLLRHCGLNAHVFNYSYPREEHPLNLGFVAEREAAAEAGGKPLDLLKTLALIPQIERFVDLATIKPVQCDQNGDQLLVRAMQLACGRRPSLVKRALSRLSRIIQ